MDQVWLIRCEKAKNIITPRGRFYGNCQRSFSSFVSLAQRCLLCALCLFLSFIHLHHL